MAIVTPADDFSTELKKYSNSVSCYDIHLRGKSVFLAPRSRIANQRYTIGKAIIPLVAGECIAAVFKVLNDSSSEYIADI